MRRTMVRAAVAVLAVLAGMLAVAEPARADFNGRLDQSYVIAVKNYADWCWAVQLPAPNAPTDGLAVNTNRCGVEWNKQFTFQQAGVMPASAGAAAGRMSYYIRSRWSGGCMDVYNGLQGSGVPLQHWNCGTDGRWQVRFILERYGADANTYTIRPSYQFDQCLSFDGSPTLTTRIVTKPCGNGQHTVRIVPAS